jgi:hypothetical protein
MERAGACATGPVKAQSTPNLISQIYIRHLEDAQKKSAEYDGYDWWFCQKPLEK